MNEQDIQDKILAKGAEFEARGFRERRQSAEQSKQTTAEGGATSTSQGRAEGRTLADLPPHVLVHYLKERLEALEGFGKMICFIALGFAFFTLFLILMTPNFVWDGHPMTITFWASLLVAGLGAYLRHVSKV